MSKLTRTLVLGAMLAVMNLAAMTTVAQAQANDARRQPTEGQVEESRRQPQLASQEQTAANAALRRQLARERFSIPSGTPAQVPAPTRADEPSGQPSWLIASLSVLAAVLALVAGLALLAARRANHKLQAGQAA
jgi:hypothetical protein